MRGEISVIVRYLVSFIIAAAITFLMFWGMQALISSDNILVEEHKRIRVDLGSVREVQEVAEKERKPDEIIPEPAPTTELEISIDVGNVSDPVDLSLRETEVGNIGIGDGAVFVADGEYLPIVRVPPQYPARAAERGLEGYVVVEFTVTPTGSTVNVVAIESSHNFFVRNAIRAAERFKFKPRVVDGEPVYVEGVRNRIEFKLDDEEG